MMSVNETISSCCRNIEEADTREQRLKEVDKIKSCCSELPEEQGNEVMACCTRIETTDSKEEVSQEVQKIRSCCS